MWKTASCIEYNSLKTTYGHDRFELLLLILQPLKKNVGFFFPPPPWYILQGFKVAFPP